MSQTPRTTSLLMPLVLTPQYFGCLIFDRRNSRYLPFDDEATRLLVHLQDSHVELVANTLAPDRRPDFYEFYDYLYGLGFFDLSGNLCAEVRSVSPPSDHLVGPLAVHLEVAAACNLTCRHCFAGALPRREDALTLEELDRLFGTLNRIGCFRLGLTGGEPLLREDLFEILDLATHHGLHPCLTTNGLLLTERHAQEFARRELVWLNVSLDGATAETNDSIRGEGTFDRILEKLEILRSHARFTLAFTILRTNMHEVEQCASLAEALGAHTVVFRPLYPVGIARDHPDLMPTFDEYTAALERLTNLAHGPSDLHPIDPFSPQARTQRQARTHTNNGCGAGNLVCSISHGGDVNPCSFLGPDHVAANVRSRDFADIWNESSVFRDLRRPGSGVADEFAGGCRARSLAFNGSIHARDPWHDAWRSQAAGVEIPAAASMHPMSNIELHPTQTGGQGACSVVSLPVLTNRTSQRSCCGSGS